ncbi:F-box protein At4g00755-like isoform X2 [Aristolochia californica]|uniref:F-box protein At4g00755-like isoform X2 n=1 Tax=Aristolochia californica TaxID=171875 RepID=UPI0035D929F1
MGDSGDFLELLGYDMSIDVLRRLDDPADLARVSSLSRSWHQFGFYKKLCIRMFPELKCCSCVVEQDNLTRPSEVGPSNFNEQDATAMEDRVFALLARELKSTIRKDNCILAAICASSTDNDPDESIVNTLDSSDIVDQRPSYWSSKGASNPEVPETLTYRLCSKLCIIEEVNIQPFKALFQDGHPIYSAEAVRFRLGFSKKTVYSLSHSEEEVVAAERFDDDDGYIWTYVSPRFPMVQENCLQTFTLPRPALCIGGILQIELLGRVQKQEMDGLYYICMCYVQVKGQPLPPVFDVEMSAAKTCLLKYCPQADCSSSPTASGEDANPTSSGGWLALADRIRQSRQVGARVWSRVRFLNALLGNVAVVHNEDEVEEGEVHIEHRMN